MRHTSVLMGVTLAVLGFPNIGTAQQGQTTINIYPPAGSPPPIINVFPPGTPVPGAGQPAVASQPAATGSSQPAAPEAPTAAWGPSSPLRATATVVGPMNQGSTKVEAEITSLKRVPGSLMLNLKMTNLGDVNANSAAVYSALSDAYILDPQSNRKAGPLQDSKFQVLASDMSATSVPAGQSRDLFVQFPEAPAGVSSVTVYLKGFPPIMNVQITQ